MATHTLFPAYIRLTYSGLLKPHHAILPVKDTGDWTPGVLPNVITVSGDTIAADAAVTAYLAVYKPLFSPDTVFSTWEAFLFDNPDAGSTFIFGASLAGQVGTGTGSPVAFSQAELTFRTSLGGNMRAIALESLAPVDTKEPAAAIGGAYTAWRDYFLSDDSAVYGRDEGRAIFAVNFITKENDALRKQAGL